MKYLKTRRDFLNDELQIESVDGSCVTKDEEMIKSNNEPLDSINHTDSTEQDQFKDKDETKDQAE